MTARVRIWDARDGERGVSAGKVTVHPGGVICAEPGEVVIVAVVDSYETAARVLTALDPALTSTEVK